MSEVSFAKSFLAALDSRPLKLSGDHVEDPRNYPSRTPYILPRMARTMSKRTAGAAAPGQERSYTVVVKSVRNPPVDVRLTGQAAHTSVLDIKTAVAQQTGLAADRIKVLHRKKPAADSKVLKDLAAEGETTVELSIMVMGGGGATAAAASPAPAPADAASDHPTAQGPSGREVIETEAFWTDLRGFLLQRVRDEKQTDELFSMFLRAWEDQS